MSDTPTVNRMVWNQMADFGPGSITVIPDELARRGYTKAFIVTDPGYRADPGLT
ncbi:MAG TPA: hypothetical protein VJU58_11165 [Microbacterium sp.]|nr:hypothetical protein [Microbacterium sp.]